MSKVIGEVKVMKADERTSAKSGNKYFVCSGMTDEKELVSFFASANDNPKEGDVYHQILGYSRFEAVVRYQKKQ